jgi:HEAT repeat protein
MEAGPSEGRTAGAQFLASLGQRLGARDEEARSLVAASLFQFSFVAGVAILKAATNALLVHRVEDPRALPLLYVASSLITGGLAVVESITHPHKRWPPTLTFTVWVLILLTLSALAQGGTLLAVAGLYLAVELYATTLSVRFWGRMGEVFDLRASRRLLGIVGGVGMAGSIFGGMITRGFGEQLGALRLIPAGCVTLVACLTLAPGIRNPASRPSIAPLPRTAASAGEARRYVLRDGLPRTMALLAALFGVGTALADFLFRYRARETLDDGQLAALFGGLSVVVGVVAMVVQLGLTNVLLKRVGLFTYLLLTPFGVFAASIAAAIAPGLWAAYSLKALEQVGALSLTQTGTQLLYGPMPDAVKGTARSVVDGFGKKGGYALGGLLLLTLADTGWAEHLPWVAAAVALAAALMVLRVRTQYVRAIGDRLQAPASSEDLALADSTSRRVLEEAVTSPDERRVLTALELLSRDRGARLEPVLVTLLEHRSARVRVQAARLAGERGAQSCAVKLAELASRDEPIVREAAIDAVALLRPFTAARLLGPLLAHPDLGTRAAAIAALVPLDPSGPAGQALDELLSRGGHALPGERVQVARLLGRLGATTAAKRLKEYLADPTPIVRRAACLAAGRSGSLELVDDLLVLLVARETRPDARQALGGLGDRILPKIEEILNDRTQPADLRYRLPRVLREIGTSRALEVILFSNTQDDPFLQYRLSMAASRIRERDPEIDFDRRRAIDAAGRRIDAYESLAPAARDLEAALGSQNLLVRACLDRLDQHLESIIRLCSLLYPSRQVVNAFNRFIDGDARTRPYAIELLEHTIADGPISRRVVAVLERWHRRHDWSDRGRLERAPGRLLELVAAPDTVLRAIVITTLRQLAAARAAPAPHGAPEDGSGIHALARLARGPAWDVLLNALPAIPEEGPVSESIVEKVLFLEGVDIFAESDVDDLTAVAQYVREKSFLQGEMVFHENDSGDSLYVILEGHVRIEKDRKQIMELGPRDSFGETSLLDNNPRPASARALTDLRVLVLERADFLDLVSDRVELLRGIFRAMTKQFRGVLDAAAAGRITNPHLSPVSVSRVPRTKTSPGAA